jgi:hypothetical protein
MAKEKGGKKSIDISNLADENHRYAIHLATFQKLISYRHGIFEISDGSILDAHASVDFWRNISLSAEILLKACLLKHEIPFFRKRAHGEYGQKVKATSNPVLEQMLKEKGINYIAEINTGTVSTALKSAEEELFAKIALDQISSQLISKMFYIIIRTRRNRNSHFYFPNQASIDTAEIEMLYLPLLNRLEEIYRLKPNTTK